MAKVKNPFSRIRLVYRRSSTLLKVVVLVTIVLSIAAVLTLRSALIRYDRQQEDLRNQILDLEEENQKLKDRIEDLGSVQSIEQIAQDELGLVDPDTVIIEPQQ